MCRYAVWDIRLPMEVMRNDRRDDTASYGYVHITTANHIGDDAAGWLNEVIRRWS